MRDDVELSPWACCVEQLLGMAIVEKDPTECLLYSNHHGVIKSQTANENRASFDRQRVTVLKMICCDDGVDDSSIPER